MQELGSACYATQKLRGPLQVLRRIHVGAEQVFRQRDANFQAEPERPQLFQALCQLERTGWSSGQSP